MTRALAAIAAVAIGCGTGGGGGRVVGRGTLGYAVTYTDAALITVELEERFAIYVRDPDTGRLRERFEVGPAERDILAVTVASDAIYFGGAERVVRAISLADGRAVAQWPHGAVVTALAAVGDFVAIGDAEGAVCLRRVADGALVQCVDLEAGAIGDLTAVSGGLVVRAARGVHLALPTLAATATALPPPSVVGRSIVVDGRTVATFAGVARAVARGPGGRWAAVGWIRRLDDPSVIIGAGSARRRH